MSFVGQVLGGLIGLALGAWLVFGAEVFGPEPGWALLVIVITGFAGAQIGSCIGMNLAGR